MTFDEWWREVNHDGLVWERMAYREVARLAFESGLREAAGIISAKVHDLIGICEIYQNNDGCECDVEECYQLSKDVIRAANVILAAIPPQPACGTCNGHGEIGGFVGGPENGSYQMDPCPDCSPPNIGEGEQCEWGKPYMYHREMVQDTTCGKCVERSDDDMKFCPYCGKPIRIKE